MAAVRLCRDGRAEALMKGSLHTDELMGAVVSREGGLRTARRISHVFAMDVPSYPKALFVTDAAINIVPDLMTKVDIVQNAVDMLRALGNPQPKVAILSAVETVNPKIPGTLDAAALCKMADRGQITGALLDGPLAFDNAISRAAAQIKKITSPVAGEADILMVPDLEAGNMLAKQLSYLAGADSAGIVLGAKVPIAPDQPGGQRGLAAGVRRTGATAGGSEGEGRMSEGLIGVVNAGSSSLKFSVYAGDECLLNGQVDGIGVRPVANVKTGKGEALPPPDFSAAPPATPGDALTALLPRLQHWLAGRALAAIGHRVVHGGPNYAAPARVTPALLEELKAFIPLAPLHQPHNLSPIQAALDRNPGLPQIACFDTAFHRTIPEVAQVFALPYAMAERGIRRYGFHGLSYEYIASVLPQVAPAIAGGRVVVAHLGNGASLCALQAGRSMATTMGFSALDGLPMGTRCGQLDPAVVLHLLTTKAWISKAIEDLLYRKSGMLGLSGISSDFRDLLESDQLRARFAIEVFVHQVARNLASLAGSMGGLDGIVFTAGVGENAAPIREAVCRACTWMGVELDATANAARAPRIHAEQPRRLQSSRPTRTS